MAFDAGGIIGSLELNTSNYDAGIHHADQEAGEAEGVLSGMMMGLASTMGDGLGEAAIGAAEAIAGIASDNVMETLQGLETVLVGIAETTESVAHQFHQIGLAAEKTGTSTEFMSHLEAQASAAGIGIESVVTGMKVLEQRAEEAGEGSKEAARGFERLGISAQQAAEMAGDPQGLFQLVQDRISGMSSAAERTAASLGVMGRQGFNLVPVLTQTSDELKRMADFSDQVGATVTDNDAEMGKSFGQLHEMFSLTMQGIENEAGRPILQFLQDHMGELKEIMLDVSKVGHDVLGPMFKYLAGLAGDLAPVVRDLAHDLRVLVEDAEKAWRFLHGDGWTLPSQPPKSDDQKVRDVHVNVDPSDSVGKLADLIQQAMRRGDSAMAAKLLTAQVADNVVNTIAGNGGGW